MLLLLKFHREESNIKSFTSIQQLYKHIQDKVNETLMDEVSEEVKKVESEAVDGVVYSVFKPSVYRRREDEGGLSDMRNMRTYLVDDGIIEIENRTMAYPHLSSGRLSKNVGKYTTPIVVTGEGYDIPRLPYAVPRDFIQETKDRLESSGVHVEALKEGLRKRGINVG